MIVYVEACGGADGIVARSAKTDLSVVNVLAGSYVVSDVLAFNNPHAGARIRQLPVASFFSTLVPRTPPRLEDGEIKSKCFALQLRFKS